MVAGTVSFNKVMLSSVDFKYHITLERPCMTTFSNTEKRVENTTRSEVFLTSSRKCGQTLS